LLTLVVGVMIAGIIIPIANAQGTYTVSITIAGMPGTISTNVYVDGAFNTTMVGSQTSSFSFGSSSVGHVITVDSYTPSSLGANGTRYFVQEASWGFSAGGSHTFTYMPQYYLTVQTPYSTSTGQGWYSSGASAQARVRDEQIDEGQGTRQVFAGWSEDAAGTDTTSNIILMTSPKTALANWKIQFFLTVQSDPPNASGLAGSGWYDSGSGATFSANTVVEATDNTRLKFDHWSGDYTGQSPTGQLLMDRPHTVRANFFSQYLLLVQYDPAGISAKYNESNAGWYNAKANVQVGPAPSTLDLSSVERLRFVGWVDNGSSFSTPSYTVVMDQPRTITLSYMTQYYVDVRSSHGSVSGSGWYDRGATAVIIVAGGEQSWPIVYTLTDLRLDPPTGALQKAGTSWNLTVDRPYVVQADWRLDYVPFVALLGSGGIAAVLAVGFVLAYKRGVFSRGGEISQPPTTSQELLGATEVCKSCGNLVPKGEFCEKCGAPLEESAASSLDEKVYDYIVKNEGVISLSKASSDLGLPVSELKEITERLKRQGRLA
jgi:hypothetical protein